MDPNTSSMFITILLMVAVFYFLFMRPENKRKKAAEQMRNSVKKGDNIVTIGGIIGRVVMVSGDNIVFETSEDRVRLEVTKWALSSVNGQSPNAPAKKKADAAEEKAPANEPENVVEEAPASEEE